MNKKTLLSIFALSMAIFSCLPASLPQFSPEVFPVQTNETAAFKSVLETLLNGFKFRTAGTINRSSQRSLSMLKNDVVTANGLFEKLSATNAISGEEFGDLINFFFDYCEEKRLYKHHIDEIRSILESALDTVGYSPRKTQIRGFLMTLNRIFREDYASEYTPGQAMFNTCIRVPARFVAAHPIATLAILGTTVGGVLLIKKLRDKSKEKPEAGDSSDGDSGDDGDDGDGDGKKKKLLEIDSTKPFNSKFGITNPRVESSFQEGPFSCGPRALAAMLDLEFNKQFLQASLNAQSELAELEGGILLSQMQKSLQRVVTRTAVANLTTEKIENMTKSEIVLVQKLLQTAGNRQTTMSWADTKNTAEKNIKMFHADTIKFLIHKLAKGANPKCIELFRDKNVPKNFSRNMEFVDDFLIVEDQVLDGFTSVIDGKIKKSAFLTEDAHRNLAMACHKSTDGKAVRVLLLKPGHWVTMKVSRLRNGKALIAGYKCSIGVSPHADPTVESLKKAFAKGADCFTTTEILKPESVLLNSAILHSLQLIVPEEDGNRFVLPAFQALKSYPKFPTTGKWTDLSDEESAIKATLSQCATDILPHISSNDGKVNKAGLKA
ncbi:hypothetical protein KAU11_03160, partial [Candidatus Babeliales bacterium]|nr:hypothetical protein [Candidatus Babeliales bacterium]